jgi:hypothetical protein
MSRGRSEAEKNQQIKIRSQCERTIFLSLDDTNRPHSGHLPRQVGVVDDFDDVVEEVG